MDPDHHADMIRIDDLAQMSAISVSAFHRREHRPQFGMPPGQDAERLRRQAENPAFTPSPS